jgi:hypothetical protein
MQTTTYPQHPCVFFVERALRYLSYCVLCRNQFPYYILHIYDHAHTITRLGPRPNIGRRRRHVAHCSGSLVTVHPQTPGGLLDTRGSPALGGPGEKSSGHEHAPSTRPQPPAVRENRRSEAACLDNKCTRKYEACSDIDIDADRFLLRWYVVRQDKEPRLTRPAPRTSRGFGVLLNAAACFLLSFSLSGILER